MRNLMTFLIGCLNRVKIKTRHLLVNSHKINISYYYKYVLTSSAQDNEESVPALSYKLDHEKLDHLPECELLVLLGMKKFKISFLMNYN